MTIQQTIKSRRVRIDALLQNARRMTTSSETTLAYRSLQMSKHSLGNILRLSGEESPYKEVTEVSNIPPTADVSKKEAFELSDDQLENVNKIREGIEKELQNFTMDFHLQLAQDKPSLIGNLLFEHWNNLAQAKNWYGEELSSMREKAKESEVKASLANDTSEPEEGEEKEPKGKKKSSAKKIVDKES